jgi:hypothetical protein
MGVLFGWGASPDPSLQGSEERKPTETGTTLELLVATLAVTQLALRPSSEFSGAPTPLLRLLQPMPPAADLILHSPLEM